MLLLLAIATQVLSAPVLVSQSFTGNAFDNADGNCRLSILGWVVSGGLPHVTECSGTKMFGGFGKFGARAVASKIFELPPHSLINLKV